VLPAATLSELGPDVPLYVVVTPPVVTLKRSKSDSV